MIKNQSSPFIVAETDKTTASNFSFGMDFKDSNLYSCITSS